MYTVGVRIDRQVKSIVLTPLSKYKERSTRVNNFLFLLHKAEYINSLSKLSFQDLKLKSTTIHFLHSKLCDIIGMSTFFNPLKFSVWVSTSDVLTAHLTKPLSIHTLHTTHTMHTLHEVREGVLGIFKGSMLTTCLRNHRDQLRILSRSPVMPEISPESFCTANFPKQSQHQ